MEKADYLHLLKTDVAAWNETRPRKTADLTNANLTNANLTNANLSGARLSGADLRDADLSNADLTNANLFGAKLNRADLTNANLTNADLSRARLNRADLTNANLSGATLNRADLVHTDLVEADLSNADLDRADFFYAKLTDANLSDADLSNADLTNADLTNANLTNANLTNANLRSSRIHLAHLCSANLKAADFSRAVASATRFDDVDLSECKGLIDIKHNWPSSVGVDTLFRSGPGLPKKFLRGCGIDPNFIAFIDSHVTPVSLTYYRTFLSYSTRDQAFANKLYGSLFNDRGIMTWQDQHQILPGDNLISEIDRAINHKTDKMLLVCSKASLTGESSWWIEREIERAFGREMEHQKRTGEQLTYLIPIAIDDFLFTDQCTMRYKSDLLARRVENFADWAGDDDAYQRVLNKTVNAIRMKPITLPDFRNM